ncbi:hypothetical protein HI914_02148 [Erysiphe necator]|uniref:NADH dehydrogenase [ubiquinone] 1 beta subcomplex subunit 11, mitochondrial n=1 Tax=Uncinula necator TaxID=52586 RepID=A0A0B1PET5_UNCNE|nr:hypothetical protein HI914_02148 [Erysiphe necator]KHJ35149.1 putative nadh:ubiquinone oxidoreductase subunit protein [Erysiphe necator]
MTKISTSFTALRTARSFRASNIICFPRIRCFSTTDELCGSDHAHESHYDPPGGWLFGVKPGEKRKKEDWEDIWVYGFFGSLAFGVVGYAFKPDTSIQTWALEEARRRLEIEGILEEPQDSHIKKP